MAAVTFFFRNRLCEKATIGFEGRAARNSDWLLPDV
jgi:hypothetical protein